jgi:integrase
MRRGEMFKLRWSDVDFQQLAIRVMATNTKTLTARSVPITTRLAEELRELSQVCESDDALVFGITSSVKTSFLAACRDAGIKDFRLHDARHTAASRMIEGGMQIVEVSRILGHRSLKTTYGYTNTNADTVTRAGDALNRLNSEAITREAAAVIN